MAQARASSSFGASIAFAFACSNDICVTGSASIAVHFLKPSSKPPKSTEKACLPMANQRTIETFATEKDLHENTQQSHTTHFRKDQFGRQGASSMRGKTSPSDSSAAGSSIVQIESKQAPKRPIHRTAYLDGLRGFAALLVYSLHHTNWARADWVERGILENAFGWERHYNFTTLPGIRILFSGGHTAVAVFFIISGYVLSVKPLSIIQSRSSKPGELGKHLASALFRRWIRLYLPVLFVTFWWMTTWHIFGIRSSHPDALRPEKTYRDEVWRWYCDFKNFSFIFSENTNHYNDHAWSIPLEFRGSIVIWTSLLALSECRTATRLFLEAGLAWYFLYIVDGWYCALFMTGALLCDIDLLLISNEAPALLTRNIGQWFWWSLLFIALYLGGVPSISNDINTLKTEPGWYYLAFLKPQAMWDFRWFFRFWAATFAMIAIPRLPVQKFFETRICQYLGKISFALYLVHGPILWTVGDRIYAATGRPQESSLSLAPRWINLFRFPGWGPFCLEVNFLAAHLILLPLTLGIAELVTSLVDGPSVKFAAWVFTTFGRQERAMFESKHAL